MIWLTVKQLSQIYSSRDANRKIQFLCRSILDGICLSVSGWNEFSDGFPIFLMVFDTGIMLFPAVRFLEKY
jgi:hypothetical protein